MNKKKIYRSTLIVMLAINIIAIMYMLYYKIETSIPNNVKIFANREENFDFNAPVEGTIENNESNNIEVINQSGKKVLSKDAHINMSEPFSIASKSKGNYKLNVKLFGIINLKDVNIDVIEPMKLSPSGLSIGIYLETDGVLVLGTGPILAMDGLNYEPAINILKSGDYIIAINNTEINTKKELVEEINKSFGEEEVITVRRNGKIVNAKIKPVKTPSGEYKIGTWVRDNTQGIGTMTFVNDKNKFGALGHGIADIDTGGLIDIRKGYIYNSDIVSIVKGKNGEPGEIIGKIDKSLDKEIGKINKNVNQGIYGDTNDNVIVSNKFIDIGFKQEVKIGKASIYSQVSDQIKEYEIEIEKVERSNRRINKGLVIKITDKRLLNDTNGIIQGMSGSPIIQNGKLIGAVTHVFVDDSTKGYGTFIENMLKNAM